MTKRNKNHNKKSNNLDVYTYLTTWFKNRNDLIMYTNLLDSQCLYDISKSTLSLVPSNTFNSLTISKRAEDGYLHREFEDCFSKIGGYKASMIIIDHGGEIKKYPYRLNIIDGDYDDDEILKARAIAKKANIPLNIIDGQDEKLQEKESNNNKIWNQLINKSKEEADGHFTIMKFTTNWRCSIGTITDGNKIELMAEGKTIEEAIQNCLLNKNKTTKKTTYQDILIELQNMDYKEYLQSEHWLHFRDEAYKWANYKCQLCDKGNTILNVHHKNYENRGRETFNDVIVLCQKCHSKFHDKYSHE